MNDFYLKIHNNLPDVKNNLHGNFFQKIFLDIKNKENIVETFYNFTLFDKYKIFRQPFIMTIYGKKDSLKTRFSYFLAKNLLKSNIPVYLINCGDFSYDILKQEFDDCLDQTIIIFENEIEKINTILRELPNGSHIFIDSLISAYSYYFVKYNLEYYHFGKILKDNMDKKEHRIYLISEINGFTNKPLFDIFRGFVTYEVECKRLKSYKKKYIKKNEFTFEKFSYSTIYCIDFKNFGKQYIDAKIKKKIESSDFVKLKTT